MDSNIVSHLEKIHESGKRDFRWENLRLLVKKYVTGPCVLDAGCGTGHMTLSLLNEGYKVTAIDCVDELTSFTQKILAQNDQNASIHTMNLMDVKSLGSGIYDTVICLDVLEHIADDKIALNNLVYTLKEEATLIVSVPAFSFLYGVRDREIGHYRRYNRSDLVKLIEGSGLKVMRIRYWNFLGFLPVIISEKLLKKQINEEFRYRNKAPFYYGFLNKWFSTVENNVSFPVGLSLIAICKKPSYKK